MPARTRSTRLAVTTGALLALAALAPSSASAAGAPATPAVGSRAAAPAAAPAPAVDVASRTRLAGLKTVDVQLRNPYVKKDVLAPGWTVAKKAAAKSEGAVCTDPSIAGRVKNTYLCTPMALSAIACYAKTGYTDVVTCVVDPRAKKLIEYRTSAPLRPTPVSSLLERRPIAAELSNGTYCRATGSGAAVRPGTDDISWAGCDGTPGFRLWQKPDLTNQFRVSRGLVQYRAASEDVKVPIRWVDVKTRYWLG